ncbi:hypothetical protein Poli38472_003399 [Pythium oligandrum]|uniref:RWP-RK domain-containing protein n=1 Tax=Pythium oligandrum TaxID=41045 RepID=A0A8K1C6F9_PYTOL|nr:hypothetical protein Poli38472_003399 [Pythium oligandrum]|eukprot:TMW57474.1 hypothetical protein Poli38472_003399 [Pythium oligandrum]
MASSTTASSTPKGSVKSLDEIATEEKPMATMMTADEDFTIATPTATTNFSSKMDFQSPMPHARLAAVSLLTPPSGRRAMMSMHSGSSLGFPIACNFEALSHHFHLPLKVAAEKFGVRATAFKKRCRAIGIRHWPYRKVRSLKRSLQELGKCREQGILNDKQHHQLHVFQGQLDKLLSPETYGIDPSGCLPPGAFDDVDDNEHDSAEDGDGDDDDVSCTSNQSPRVDSTTTFSNFKITSFRSKRLKKQLANGSQSPTAIKRDFTLPSGIITTPQHSHPYFLASDGSDPPRAGFFHGGDLPSVSVRFASSGNHGLAAFDPYDPFFQDFKSDFTLTMEDFGSDDHTSSSSLVEEAAANDFFPFIRSPTMAAIRCSAPRDGREEDDSDLPSWPALAPSSSTDNPNDAGDDDVFLHISPDYGCLV